ncbi:MAG: magnesium chelatase domain-containing protein [Clostridiaceae bacterium]
MFSKINSIYLRGMEGKNVTVEADVSDGLPGLILVGYLASEVREGGDRVRTAIKNLGLSLPPKKITINLSPADFRKEGTGFDLAIAAAILSAYGGFRAKDLEDAVLFGELGLDGTVRGIPGVMALTDQARESGFKRVFLPVENVNEASVIGGNGTLWDPGSETSPGGAFGKASLCRRSQR